LGVLNLNFVVCAEKKESTINVVEFLIRGNDFRLCISTALENVL